MAYTAKVAGATAARFRAYAHAALTHKPSVDEHIAAAQEGKKLKRTTRLPHLGEQVAIEGPVSGDKLAFNSGKHKITRVVFYNGPVEEEVVVGSVEVNAEGPIEIELVEPDEDE